MSAYTWLIIIIYRSADLRVLIYRLFTFVEFEILEELWNVVSKNLYT